MSPAPQIIASLPQFATICRNSSLNCHKICCAPIVFKHRLVTQLQRVTYVLMMKPAASSSLWPTTATSSSSSYPPPHRRHPPTPDSVLGCAFPRNSWGIPIPQGFQERAFENWGIGRNVVPCSKGIKIIGSTIYHEERTKTHSLFKGNEFLSSFR